MEVEDWHVLWRAIAGDNFRDIPAEGSFVFYHPLIHVQQSEDPITPLAYRDPLLCRVNEVSLMSRDYPGCQIFVRFILAPVNELVVPEAGGYLHINEGGPVYQKILSPHDLVRRSIAVSANMANGLFDPAPEVEMQVPLTYMREALPAQFNYKRKGITRRLSEGWANFLIGKEFNGGDTLIFTRINDNIVVGLRRRSPFKVPTMMLRIASLSHAAGEYFRVDYYPQAGDPVVTLIEGEDDEEYEE